MTFWGLVLAIVVALVVVGFVLPIVVYLMVMAAGAAMWLVGKAWEVLTR